MIGNRAYAEEITRRIFALNLQEPNQDILRLQITLQIMDVIQQVKEDTLSAVIRRLGSEMEGGGK